MCLRRPIAHYLWLRPTMGPNKDIMEMNVTINSVTSTSINATATIFYSDVVRLNGTNLSNFLSSYTPMASNTFCDFYKASNMCKQILYSVE